MTDEPVWLRDAHASLMELHIPQGDDPDTVLADVFKEEKYHCELCGAPFPLWPPRGFAGHYLKEHSQDFTVQGLASFSMMCLPGVGEAARLFMMSQLFTRVGPRRRALELGLWHPCGRIIQPGSPQ
jgi:hypothetical protein